VSLPKGHDAQVALPARVLVLHGEPWQALPKGLPHVKKCVCSCLLFHPGRPCPKACCMHVFEQVLLHVSPWQALSKGLLHVHRNMFFFTWQALPKGLLHVEHADHDSKNKSKTWFLLGGFWVLVLIVLLIFPCILDTFSIDFVAQKPIVLY